MEKQKNPFESTGALSVEAYERRYHQWSEKFGKRSRGAVGVHFQPINDKYCLANASIWGLDGDEYRAGKNLLMTSPQSQSEVLGNMYARDHEGMANFIQDFDVESDPKYEGLIPGTVSLDGYMNECNRLKKIAAARKPATSIEDEKLCTTCLNLCLDEASSNKGCNSCGLLRSGINLMKRWFPTPEQTTWKPPDRIDGYAMLQREGCTVGDQRPGFPGGDGAINAAYGRGCGLCVTYVYRTSAEDVLGTAIDLDFFQDQDDPPSPWRSIRRASQISGDTSSDESFTRALSWLETCQKSHTCSRLQNKCLPQRVLDLGTDGWESKSSVKLIETNNEPADYVCLSYCWGQTQNLTTTTLNMESHRDCIRWSSLPLTFQDAVTFTRRLNIRYLWIDSLCIVQDNDIDWQGQASCMPSIYENSYVTLAATASDNSAGGCFHKAEAKYIAKGIVTRDKDGKQYKIHVRQHLPHWLKADPRYSELSREEFPILDRAWILQERFLSPRVIHFGRHELFWECKEGAACECSFLNSVGREHLDKTRHHQPMDQISDRKSLSQAQKQLQHQASPAQRWRALVSRYSSLKLTKDDDILPALSGLAKQMNRELRDSYLAGLWKNNLPLDLLWQNNEPATEKSSVWRAPSWSWAHYKSRVSWVSDTVNECEPEIHLNILNTDQVLIGSNMMGAISSASICVQVYMCPVTLIVYPLKSSRGQISADLVVNDTIINDLPNPGARLFSLRIEISLDFRMSPTTTCLDRYDTSSPKAGYNVHCIRIATLSSKDYSLIVRSGSKMSHYERLGIVSEYVGYSEDRTESILPWKDSARSSRQTITLV